MLLATLTKEIELPADQLVLLNGLGFGLLIAGFYVYRKMIRRVEARGGLVRSDLFALSDLVVVGTLVVLLGLLVALQWIVPASPKPPIDP